MKFPDPNSIVHLIKFLLHSEKSIHPATWEKLANLSGPGSEYEKWVFSSLTTVIHASSCYMWVIASSFSSFGDLKQGRRWLERERLNTIGLMS